MVVAALRVVTSRNVVHAALFLVLTLAASAGLFILLSAEFVAWVLVLVSIGGRDRAVPVRDHDHSGAHRTMRPTSAIPAGSAGSRNVATLALFLAVTLWLIWGWSRPRSWPGSANPSRCDRFRHRHRHPRGRVHHPLPDPSSRRWVHPAGGPDRRHHAGRKDLTPAEEAEDPLPGEESRAGMTRCSVRDPPSI